MSAKYPFVVSVSRCSAPSNPVIPSNTSSPNKVTIRDSGMPPSVDEFSEDFARYPITSAIDYFSGYYQIPLDKSSRGLTAFMSLLGLVRMTRLPQGWTNSVAEFMRIIGKVHYRQIPHEVRPFLDDVGIKGPKSRYNDEEISPGVRRFVFEHAQIFRRFMYDCWIAGLKISGSKSAIGMSGIEIVGFLCDQDARRPEPKKVQRILDWSVTKSLPMHANLSALSSIIVFSISVLRPLRSPFSRCSGRASISFGPMSVRWRWIRLRSKLRRRLSSLLSIFQPQHFLLLFTSTLLQR
jgi:hypothetical protein